MDYFTLSKAGDRDINEDAACVFETGDKKVFILADGLGGHGYGEIASQTTASLAKEYIVKNNDLKKENLLKHVFAEANKKLKEMQREAGNSSFFKTTLVILIIDDKECAWGHIGDSRLYHFEGRDLVERTMDHSVPQMLVNAGKISEKQIRHHEDRSKLLKVLGAQEENSSPFIVDSQPIGAKTAFLLCSDGFWEYIDERRMKKCISRANSAQEWIEEMEKTVLKNGKKYNMDNYSAIAVII